MAEVVAQTGELKYKGVELKLWLISIHYGYHFLGKISRAKAVLKASVRC